MIRLAVLVAAMLFAACGSAAVPPSAQPTDGPPFSSADPTDELPRQSNASPTPVATLIPFAEATDPSAAAASEMELVRQLRTETGMPALLGSNGGRAFADLDGLQDEFAQELIRDVAAAIDAGGLPREGNRLPSGIASVGEAPITADRQPNAIDVSLFAQTGFTASAIMSIYAQVIQQAAETRNATLPRSESMDQTANGLRHQVDVSTTFVVQTGGARVSADIIMSATDRITDAATGSFIALYTSRSTGHFDVNACPDRAGVGEGTYTFETRHELNDVSGAQSASHAAGRAVDAKFRLINGDDAHLLRIEAALDMQADGRGPGTPSGPGPTGPFDWGATQQLQVTMPVRGSTTATGTGVSVTGTGGEAAGGAMFVSSGIAQLFISQVGREAEAFWRKGECIELKPDEESRTVRPNDEISLTVPAEHKWDRMPVAAPIKAEFTGQKSLTPTGTEQPAPARFTFVAGPNEGDKGTIALTQTGTRGIGRATLEFTVSGLDYKGDFSGRRMAGTITYCGSAREPYWGLDLVGGNGDRAFVAYDIPAGSADPVPAEVVTPFITSLRDLLPGTGQFVPGDPAQFILVNREGTYRINLAQGQFCRPAPAATP